MRLVRGSTLALAVLLAACSSEHEAEPDAGAPPKVDCSGIAPATLDTVFAKYFAGSVATGCTTSGCHGTGAGNLGFRTAHDLWAAVVGKPSLGGSGMPLVSPHDPGNSFLLAKLQAGATNRMPMGGPYLPDAALSELAGWICAGAPEPALATADGGTDVDGGGAGDGGSPDGGDVAEAPAIDGFAPANGLVGTQVTLTGHGFSATAGENLVQFGGVPAPVTGATETSLQTSVPAGAKSGPITVTVGGRTATSAGAFDVIEPNPVPLLDTAAPDEVEAGATGVTVRLSGRNFIALSTAQLDGEALTTTPDGATAVVAQLPDTLVARAGNHTLTVVNPGPGGGTSAGVAFTVKNPVPVLTRLSPPRVPVGSGAVTVTIDGSGFVGTTRAIVNGADSDVVVTTADQLALTIPASSTSTAGSLSIAITNPAPGGGTSSAAAFTVENPAPGLTTLAPVSVLAGSGSVTLSVAGSGFVPASTVQFDGAPLGTTFVDAGHLAATLDAAATVGAASHRVEVATPGPGGGTSGALAFTVENPLPTIASLAPASVLAGSASATVTISGTGFLPGSQAAAGASALTTTWTSPTQLTAAIPGPLLATAGTLELTVANPAPGGGRSAPATFVVQNPAPILTGVAPSSVIAGSAAITLAAAGEGYVAGSSLVFDGQPLSTTFVGPTKLSATLEAALLATAGAHDVAVRTPGPGGGTSSPATFVVQNPAPSLASLSPSTLVAGSGATNVTATGSGFSAGTQVTVQGTTATVVSTTPTQLVFTVPSSQLASPGTLSVAVTNAPPGGGTSGTLSLAVVNAAPVLASVTPASVTAGSGPVTLSLAGSGFVATTQVQVDGTNVPTTYTSAAALSASIDATLTQVGGTHLVTVKTPAPGGGTSAAATFTVNNPMPAVSSLSPATVAVNGAGFTVTITGSGFNGSSTVAFNGATVSSTLVNATTMTAQIPTITAVGSYPVTVTNPTPGGGSASTSLSATNSPLPAITGISPTSAAAGASFPLTVTGANFSCATPASVVLFGGTSYPPSSCSATKLVVTIPATPAGTYDVQVKTAAQASNTVACEVVSPNPVPQLSSVSPGSAVAGDGGFTLTVNGASFVSGAVVQFNGATRTTTFVSSTRLTAAIPASDLASAGTASVTVTNPSPGGGTSGAVSFTIAAPNPVPAISAVSPASVAAGSGATTVTITGTGFVAGSTAAFNGSPRTTRYASATQLSVDLTASDTQSASSNTLTVVNPAPGGGTSGGLTFTVASQNPVPVAASLSPSSALAGGAAFTLTVNGSGFVSGSTVTFNGASRTTTFVSSTQLTAAITAADIASAGTDAIAVTSPAPGGGTSGSLDFAVLQPNPVPAVSALSPASVNAGSGAVSVSVNGSGFIAASSATFNGSARTTHFVSATQLTVDLTSTDTQTAGTAAIAVTNPAPGGGTSSSLTFTINAQNPVPVLSSLSPSTAVAGGSAFTLTANGSGFVNGSTVVFNGAARTTTFVSPTQLTAAIPAGDIATGGSYPVTVTSPAPGGGTSGALTFSVTNANPVPTISSLSPAGVTAGSGGVSVTLNGSGFVAASTANYNGSARTTHYVSASQLTMDVTATDTQNAGTYGVTVTNPAPGGGTSSSFTFTVSAPNPVPVLSSMSPAQVAAGSSSFTLTASGSGFVSGSAITFNGVAKTTTFVSSTQLTATISSADVASAGTFPVTVTSPAPGGGTSASLSFSVANPAPTLSSISPSTVQAGSAAFSLTVNGSGFVSSSQVNVDGSPRTTHFVNTTQVTADIPATDVASTGTHTITVTNPSPGGGTTGGLALTVASAPNPPPVVSALSPCGKVAGSGAFTLTLTGSSFVNGATATFNGSAVTVTYVSPTQLTAAIPGTLIATAPAGDAANVIVTNPAPGGGASNTAVFGVATKAATLSANVQPIFTNSCATNGCHDSGSAQQGLDLSAGKAYADLVGVWSSQCTSRKRVLTCGPQTSQSYLVAKLKGLDLCSGFQMPKGAPLSNANIQTIIDWVAQGAPP